MSGHNPHGRLGQPNPPWNHLQVPSYIPRQPQLAHMSNERPMVRSPLTWHTPHTENALYNYMTATHKTPLDINPILPGFGRNSAVAPFGSVDLSIPSAARHNSQLSPRNATPPVVTASGTPPLPLSSQSAPQSLEFNISTSKSLLGAATQQSSIGVIQSTGSAKEKIQSLSSNTSNGDLLHSTSSTAPPVARTPPTQSMLYVRDAQQINNDISIFGQREPIGLPPAVEPIQLVKEVLYNTLKNASEHILPIRQKSPDKLLPLPPPVIASATAPVPPQLPPPLLLPPATTTMTTVSVAASISPSIILPSAPPHQQNNAIVSGTGTETHEQPSGIAFTSTSSVSVPQHPNENFFPKDGQTSTSNDDSLDSTSGKRRRKRKPSKTTRMSNNDNDDNYRSSTNNNKRICMDDDESTVKSVGSSSGSSIVANLEPNQQTLPTAVLSQTSLLISPVVGPGIASETPAHTDDDDDTSSRREESSIRTTSTPDDTSIGTVEPTAPMFPTPLNLHEKTSNEREEPMPVISQTDSPASPSPEPVHPVSLPLLIPNHASVIKEALEIGNIQPTLVNSNESQQADTMSNAILPQSSNSNTTTIVNDKRKSDPDDCETIDKIAAMIASTSSDYEQDSELVSCLPLQPSASVKIPPVSDAVPVDETDSLKEILSSSQEKVEQKDSSYEEVENKLEEMFAGIEDDRPLSIAPDDTKLVKSEQDGDCKSLKEIDRKESKSPIPLLSNSNVSDKLSTVPTNTAASSVDGGGAPSAKLEKNAPKGRKKYTKKSGAQTKNKKAKNNTSKLKEKSTTGSDKKAVTKARDDTATSIDLLRYKGPFVQLKCDGNTVVVNTPITEEVAENKAKIKKSFTTQKTNDRNKIRGLHVSTLSMKYDADTTDKTWICVFCKMGPHKFGLGDLFGPYILTTTCEEYLLSQIDPKEDEFKSKRTKADMIQKRGLPVAAAVPTTNSSGHPKKKRKTSEVHSGNAIAGPSSVAAPVAFSTAATSPITNIFYGMTKATDDSYEVWLHGDCAVWSSGVHIIGTRIVGLEAAVWSSTRYQCTLCMRYGGAMLSCLKRGCHESAHLPCARIANWSLNESDFKSLCDKHKCGVESMVSGCNDVYRNKSSTVALS